MRQTSQSPAYPPPSAIAETFLDPIEMKALALTILAIVISATTAFLISLLPSLLASPRETESTAHSGTIELSSTSRRHRLGDRPRLFDKRKAERLEWEQIARHDELLSALTERAEAGYETRSLEMRPVLLTLGREIDEARFALEMWRAERHSSAAAALRARLEKRLAAMHTAGLRALAARKATDGIGGGLAINLSTSNGRDSDRIPELPEDVEPLSADLPTQD